MEENTVTYGAGSSTPEEDKERLVDLLMSRMVVPTQAEFQSQPRDGMGQGHLRLRDAAIAHFNRIARVFGGRDMGKIYGIHDSYCDLVGPSGGGPGVAKFCTCDSGKKAMVEMHERAEWQSRAEAHADDTIGALMINNPTPVEEANILKMRTILVESWKKAHPRVGVTAPTPPPAAPEPRDDGPGEEDGPWAEGHEKRVSGGDGVALESAAHPPQNHAKHCGYYMSRDGKCTCALSRLGKLDQNKPKPFMFFLQQFPLALTRVAAHMEKGCGDPGHVFLGWLDVENGFERYTDAMLRHLLEEVVGTVTTTDREEGYDRGWKEEQAAIAVAANAMIRLELLLRKRRNLNLARDATP